MASLWTLFTKGYAEYEMEKLQDTFKPSKQKLLDISFKQGLYSCDNEEIYQLHEFAKDVGNTEQERLLLDEMKRRGMA